MGILAANGMEEASVRKALKPQVFPKARAQKATETVPGTIDLLRCRARGI